MVKLFGKTIRKSKGQKGGKVLGQGSFGCVVDSIVGKNGTVSKLINLDEIQEDSPEMKEIIDEYTKGEIFRKKDPKNRFFLPVLSMKRMSGKEASHKVRHDLETCGYSRNGKILNFSIKRGGDFNKIGVILTEKELLKSLLYSLHGAKKCVDQLDTGLLDIKPDNFLFGITNNDNKEYLHPTFIDFSSNFVLTSEQEFMSFLMRWGSNTEPTYYQYWSHEILTMIYMTYDKYGGKGMTKDEKEEERQEFINQVTAYHGIKSKYMFAENIQKYAIGKLSEKDGYKKLMKGAMTWAIAKSYYHLFSQKQSKHTNILKKMLLHDPQKRLSLEQSIKNVESALKMKNTMPHEVAIDITKHKHKKEIYKIFGIGPKQIKKLNFFRDVFAIKKKEQRKIKSSTMTRKQPGLKNKRLTKSQKVTILNRGL